MTEPTDNEPRPTPVFETDDMPHLLARFNAVDKTRQMMAMEIVKRLRDRGSPFVGDGGDVLPEAMRSLTEEEHAHMHTLEEGFEVYPFVGGEENQKVSLGIELVGNALQDIDADAYMAYMHLLLTADLVTRCFNCDQPLMPDEQAVPCDNCGDVGHILTEEDFAAADEWLGIDDEDEEDPNP